jgi:hypothetical protein
VRRVYIVDTIAYRFFLEHKAELLRLVESYLAGNGDLNSIRDYAWKVIDDWNELEKATPVLESEPYGKGEKAFWALIWDVEHLANEVPVRDDLNKKEIKMLYESLKNMSDLPKGIDAKRP